MVNENTDDDKQMYTINDVMRILNIGDKSVRRMIKAGKLDATMVLGMWRIYPSSVQAILKNPSKKEN